MTARKLLLTAGATTLVAAAAVFGRAEVADSAP